MKAVAQQQPGTSTSQPADSSFRLVSTAHAQYLLIGVDHCSSADAAFASREILSMRPSPSVVMVELCESRASFLGVTGGTAAWAPPPQQHALSVVSALASVGTPYKAALALEADRDAAAIGGDAVAAAAAARAVGARLILGDRDVGLTVRRLVAESGWRDIAFALPAALAGMELGPAQARPARLALAALAHGVMSAFWASLGAWEAAADALARIATAAESTSWGSATPAGAAAGAWNTLAIEALRSGRVESRERLAEARARVSSALLRDRLSRAAIPRALGVERDAMLACALQRETPPGALAVAVVGRAHIDGMAANLAAAAAQRDAALVTEALREPAASHISMLGCAAGGSIAYTAVLAASLKGPRRLPRAAQIFFRRAAAATSLLGAGALVVFHGVTCASSRVVSALSRERE
jgi:pheromone shutdown protein TraB